MLTAAETLEAFALFERGNNAFGGGVFPSNAGLNSIAVQEGYVGFTGAENLAFLNYSFEDLFVDMPDVDRTVLFNAAVTTHSRTSPTISNELSSRSPAYSFIDRATTKMEIGIAFVDQYQKSGGNTDYAIRSTALSYVFTERGYSIRPGYETTAIDQIGDRAYFEPQCFPSGTEIHLSDGTSSAIEAIHPGDEVAAFDGGLFRGRGALEGKHVVRLFENITETWIKLSNGLTVTPGHRFLDAAGGFRSIDAILADDGILVNEAGELEEVLGEVIRYSAETADLFEQAEGYVAQSNGPVAGQGCVFGSSLNRPANDDSAILEKIA